MKTTQDKQHTSMKIVPAILCIGIIVSVIANIYQFNSNDTLKSEIAALQSEIKTLKTDRDTLNKEIETKQTEELELSKEIDDLNTTIETLKAENQDLSDRLKALDDGINSTHTDVELGEDEYKGDEATDGANMDVSEEDEKMLKELEKEIMAEHPEWFTDTSGNTNTGDGNYEHVGTPSTGQFQNPNYTVGEGGDSGVAPGTVY